MSRVVELWRESLLRVNEKASQSLADPKDYENLFPGLLDALKTEQYLTSERQKVVPAAAYPSLPVNISNFASSGYLLVLVLRTTATATANTGLVGLA